MKSASILQTMMRRYAVQCVNHPADVVIEPEVNGIDLSEFSRTNEFAARGEKAVLEDVSKIRSLLTHLDDQLFPSDS